MCTVEARGREGGWLCFGTGKLSPFPFPLLPVVLWPTYSPVADFHLALRGDLWQVCCRGFDWGCKRKGISSRAAPDDPRGAGSGAILTPLGGPLSRACWAGPDVHRASEFSSLHFDFNEALSIYSCFTPCWCFCVLQVMETIRRVFFITQSERVKAVCGKTSWSLSLSLSAAPEPEAKVKRDT